MASDPSVRQMIPDMARDVALGAHRQCIATSKHSGERCKRAPILGGYVCALHGGGAPLVQRAARARLAALVEPAIEALTRCINSPGACPHCGRSENMAVTERAARTVLDRAGFGPTAKIELESVSDLSKLSNEELAERAEQIAEKIRAGAFDDVDDVDEDAGPDYDDMTGASPENRIAHDEAERDAADEAAALKAADMEGA